MKDREELNTYFKKINELIDVYIDKHKIRPSKLSKYLSGDRFKTFLERNGLHNVPKIDLVLNQIIKDREYMEKDNVMTFENFNIFESFVWMTPTDVLYKGIEKSNIEYEKVLADYYDTSVGHVEIVNDLEHIYTIDSLSQHDIKVLIYSSEDIKVIKENVSEYILQELNKSKINVLGQDIEISSFIDKDKYIQYINTLLEEREDEVLNKVLFSLNWSFHEKFKGYYLFVNKSQD